MYQATLTSQGQITVPVEVRNLLGLQAGDKVFFWKGEQGKYFVGKEADILELSGSLKVYSRGKKYPTKDQIAKMWVDEYKR